MDILVGIFLIVFGLTIAFLGIQVFFAILPLLGFVTGFFVGAIGVEAILGDGLLSTVTGWVAGIIIGLFFAAIAWFWWYAGVLVSAGAAGSLMASTIASAIGINSGWALFIVGAIGAALFILVAFGLNLPIYMVIVNTAIAGAAVFVNGLMLLFNQVDVKELEDGLGVATVDASWWWVLAWAVVAAVGIGRQLAHRERVRIPSDRWTQAGGVAA